MAGNFDAAEKLLQEMLEQNIPADHGVVLVVLELYAETKDLDGLLRGIFLNQINIYYKSTNRLWTRSSPSL